MAQIDEGPAPLGGARASDQGVQAGEPNTTETTSTKCEIQGGPSAGNFGDCPDCGKRQTLLFPLHCEKGGPLRCLTCGTEWHAKRTKQRRAGRIVIKAMKAYMAVGGVLKDVNQMKLAAYGFSTPGFEADNIGAEVGDITLELLTDAIQLVHPDKHPPERRELAKRVTQDLLALKPFVFPAPKPKPEPPIQPPRSNASVNSRRRELKKPSQEYPCEVCVTESPRYYCDKCKAIHDQRWQEERDRRRAKQREQYARRRQRHKRFAPKPTCEACGEQFEHKRKDAKFCSAACRQRAHRMRNGSINARDRGHKKPSRLAGR